jgi:type IV pilus assembly protein PilM
LAKPVAPAKKADKKADKGKKEGDGEEKKDEEAAEEAPAKPVSRQVLITGASNTMVQKYVTIFKAAGLEMVSLESETFPLIRSLIGKDRSATMIVDIGAVRTNIVIVENGIPYVARSLDMGGNNFTKVMSASMGIDLKEAEQMKCDIKSVSDIYPGEGLPKIFTETVMPMVTELQYSINLYTEQGEGQPNKRIERVIVTGGGSALPALVEHLGKELNTKVYVGDPWARIVYPSGLRPVLDEVGYRFGVSVGLAMRDID